MVRARDQPALRQPCNDLMKQLLSVLRSCEDRLIARYPGMARYLFLFRVDHWLVPIVVLALLLCGGGVASFLKLLPNTPEGFEPAVKVSVFDILQSKALARSAEKHERAGHVPAARAAWRGVISNTPGNVEPLRRFLTILQQDEVTLSIARDTFRYGHWLLRLTDNDPDDLELVAKTLEHGRRYTEVLKLLRSHEEFLSDSGQGTALRALFWLDHRGPFTERWSEASPTLKEDPVMKLYSLAVEAITEGDKEAYKAFLDRSKAAEPYTPEFLPAQRLAIRVHAALGNRDACRRVLEDLKKRRLATFPDHLPYWRLMSLHSGPKQNESYDVLRQYAQAKEPVSEFEAASLVSLLHEAGQTDEAFRVSRQLMEYFGNPLSLWLDHGNLLMETKRWPELKSLAMNVHQSDQLSHLWSTAKYWEGIAELFLDETEIAEARFKEIAEFPIISPATSLEMVHRLRLLGQNAAAYTVLNQLEEVIGDEQEYWILRCQIAAEDKDLASLTESATKAFERDPESMANVNNLAVALLLQRKEPEKALELSKQLIADEEESIVYQLTHIHALIQNARLTEASEALQGLKGMNVPTADVLADYRLALFELAYAQEHFEAVIAVNSEMDRQFFMPEKIAWIDETLSEAMAKTQDRATLNPQG